MLGPAIHVTAKVDYAVRATVALASRPDERLRREEIAAAQDIPGGFLKDILLALRKTGIVRGQLGPCGGYSLTRPPETITLAAVIRTVAAAPVLPSDSAADGRSTDALHEVWDALEETILSTLESVTLADIANGTLPDEIVRLAAQSKRR